MPKMLLLMNLKDTYVDRIREAAPGWEIICGKNSAVWEPHLSDAEIIAGWNAKAIETALAPKSKLRWIQTWGAGVNKMPFDDLIRKRVILTNASGVHPYPISETIMAFMLALTRQIHKYVRNQTEKKWHHAQLHLEMHGKTVGIVGVGTIGKETARLAKAFRMNVLGLRRSGEPEPYVDRMYGPNQLNEMLRQCDYVVVTVPLTKETYHMIGKEQFQAMKPTAFFINIGRGATTDTDALVDALNGREIAGAGLDVFEQEPLPSDHPLWEMENVILTPHSSGSTEHYTDRVMDIFMANLNDYINGKEPGRNRVDLEKQY